MPLKILIAGCSGDERARLEPLVRSVIGKSRATEGAWHVSLVKVGRKLSATLAGPGVRKVSFATAEEDLRTSILEALGGAGPSTQAPSAEISPESSSAPSPTAAAPATLPATATPTRTSIPASPRVPAPAPSVAPAPAPAPAEVPQEESTGMARDQHTCGECQKPYLVIYEARASEAQVTVPVACPHCWQVNQVSVSEWSAVGQEYRSEKA